MRMARDHREHDHVIATRFNVSIERRGCGVSKRVAKVPDGTKARRGSPRLVHESILQEEKSAGSVVGFALDDVMAGSRERQRGVTVKDALAPRKQAVSDFVSLIPTMLELWQ
jgi:hypothetical protein